MASAPIRLDDPRVEAVDALLGEDLLEDRTWRSAAACLGTDTSTFFPKRGAPSAPAKEACANCRVRMECLTVAVSTKVAHGFWGGESVRTRNQIRKAIVQRHPEWGLDRQELAWEEEPYEPVAGGGEAEAAAFERRPHQAEAVAAAVSELRTAEAAQVVMACGTGKTLVGLWVAEELDAQSVLIQAPSLALVGQIVRMWRAATSWGDAEWLTVCSREEDTGAVAATTDVEETRSFMQRPGRRVVVATYQSSPVVADAGVSFDLAILDEAHHLTGDTSGPSGCIIRGDISAGRRLFMTATPRVWRNTRGGVERLGMDNESVYGRRAYTLSLGQAAARGLVADYRIVLAAVDAETYGALSQSPYLSGASPEAVAAAIATVRTMAEYGLSRCVSFHSRILRAHEFSRLIGPVADLLDEAEKPEGPGWAAWLHGSSTPRTRRRLLDRLAHGPGWGILSNARLAGEGVDIPDLDTVAIVDPKNSEVDVAQAIGRVMRPSAPDKVGTVILPVAVSADGEVDEASLAVAASVLRALRSHDPDLGQQLDTARRVIGAGAASGPRSNWRTALSDRLVIRLPPNDTRKLADALTMRLVRESTASWEESFGALEAWASEHGTALIPQAEQVQLNGLSYGLGSWASTQRSAYRAGQLDPDRAKALAGLPGWTWEPQEDQWSRQYEALAAWSRVHGSADCPMRTVRDGVRIGQFINVTRLAYKAGGLSKERIEALESLPGWVWDARRSAWDSHLNDLRAWVEAHGHARPSHGDMVGEAESAFDIGRWVSKQRVKMRADLLDEDQVASLRALPGWVDHEREAAWEVGYEHLRDWIAAHGASPAQGAVGEDGYRIGAWTAKQRSAYAAGRMQTGRPERLEMLSGWSWAPRAETDSFGERVALVGRFALREGHARVPDGHVEDGVRLGQWVVMVRGWYRKGNLSPERRAALEAIPGWVWSAHDASWDMHFAALETYIGREGHAEVPGSWKEGSVSLGAWLRRQQGERGAGKLPRVRALRLDEALGRIRRAA